MITVELKNIRFHAYHGLYAEERKSGCDYDFNLSVTWPETEKITELGQTVNYARLHELVKEEMKHPRPLLETLLMEIAERIQAEYPVIKEICLSVAKLNPPIINFIGRTSVTYRKQY
jgi:dihydroneopterin aldolase